MKGPRTLFVCQDCGAQAPKWMGRCPECGAWNTLVEEVLPSPDASGSAPGLRAALSPEAGARRYDEVDLVAVERRSTGIDEFDRVLGGGLVPGSLVLLGGEPGIGKSTLLLQAASSVAARAPVLYCSGEESVQQVKLRGERLGLAGAALYLLAETCLERVLEEVTRLSPALLIVDSVQTLFSTRLPSAPGSVAQVRECAASLLALAKNRHLPTFIVGHVTKEGSLAGPKVLEHIVDTVLHFEGERHHAYRIVRAVKNRFGAVSELGVFEMTGRGLRPVTNPSELFLSRRAAATPGSAVLCCVEGSRPLLVEVQALVATSAYGNAQRTTSGLDRSRVALLLAVLEKRVGLNLVAEDVFVNVAGGLTIEEPAADLAVITAIASSVRNRPVREATAIFGEVGLGGEVRTTTHGPLRVREAMQLGYTRVVLPEGACPPADAPSGCDLVEVRTIGAALESAIAW